MEIRWLQAFIVVAEELHFSQAAVRLQVAQSPLSQTILKLERDLGVKLFERSTRSVELTAAGHALLPHAREVLRRVETARRAAHSSQGQVYGSVAIGFTGILNHVSIPPLTAAVRERFPHVDLRLVGRVLTRDAVHQLDQGILDIACVGLPVETTHISSRLIGREGLGVALPAGHALAQDKAVDLVSMAEEPFVSPPASSGSALYETMIQECSAAGFRPRIVQEVTDPSMILMLVAAGVGATLITESMAPMVTSGAVFRPLRDQTAVMRHGLAWSSRGGSPACDAVLELAEEILPTPAD